MIWIDDCCSRANYTEKWFIERLKLDEHFLFNDVLQMLSWIGWSLQINCLTDSLGYVSTVVIFPSFFNLNYDIYLTLTIISGK